MLRAALWSLLFLFAIPAVAACDPGITLTITRPTGSEAEPTVVGATANSGCAITTMRVYVDSKLVYEQHGQNFINARLVMGAGPHRVSINAWNSAGAVAHEEQFIVSTADPSEPPVGCDLPQGFGAFYGGDHVPYAAKSPIWVGMIARSESARISSIRLYIDGVDRAQIWGTTGYCLPVALMALKPGYHFINVQSWDSLGHISLTGSIVQVVQ